jgi:DNA repair protein RecO (recombination protein O)
MSLVTSRAILLRSYPYSETSRIFRFLTAELGVVGLLARGARRGDARGRGTLDTFDEGELTIHFRANRELQTFRDFMPTRSRRGLATDLVRFAGASILAELVLRHSGEEEAGALFEAVRTGLERIEAETAQDPLPRVLSEGWQIVALLGYAPILDRCIHCGEAFEESADEVGRFDFASGGIRCARCGGEHDGRRIGPIARTQLAALLGNRPPDVLSGAPAHLRLFGDFVAYHVSDSRPLNAVGFLTDLLKR